jgi:valyl-tRNA synthetase
MTENLSELPKAYEGKNIDKKWYKFWKENGYFSIDIKSKKPSFCIVIPPPNVTGVLHMGHALGCTLDDILIRWKRMNGYEALWVPGTDHAGIATQTVVERYLVQTTGKRRNDFSREEFLKHTWDWKTNSETRIIEQIQRLGCSCDWSRLRFTMDPGNNRAVRVMFKKLFDNNLIYRGDYLVNWDPVSQTALADDEVEYEEKQSYLWYFKYPVKDSSDYVKIATTRPETLLGDTAVAVFPNDPRNSKLIGKIVILPLMGREIPVIADSQVDPEFGTGMVKVTPAHDPNDYEMGLRHKLPFINIMTSDGKINENGGKFAGLTMQEARKAVVKAMDDLGLLEKTEPHTLRVGISYRSKAIIEPYLSKQWFIKMSHFAPKLRSAVQEGKVSLIPLSWQNTYYHWIDNLRDWCISRQLWWGHRIPIWYHKDNPNQIICSDQEGLPLEIIQAPDEWIQDPDVLDTWFSSALWPFATLGWPEETPELKRFYPNACMITGHDILFFWVARMIMMGEYALDRPPFPEVYLHSLIYGKSYWKNSADGGIAYLPEKERIDYELGRKLVPQDVHSKWEKMSKSKGNIIDPLEIIDEYGTDAMRMALCASATQTWEIDLDRRRFEEFKNFTNKIWNGARFVFLNLEGDSQLTSQEFSEGLNENILSLEDKWILSVLNHTVQTVNNRLENYHFDQAALEAYDFYWKDFCSYYLEIAKPILFGKAGTLEQRKNKQKLLVIVLCQAIRLIHPMAPFITEELFQILKSRFSDVSIESDIDPYTSETIKAIIAPACIVAPYPQVIRKEDIKSDINHAFCLLGQIIYAIRNIRGEMKIPPGRETRVHIVSSHNSHNLLIATENSGIIKALVRTSSVQFHTHEPELGFTSTGIVEDLKIFIPMPEDLSQKEFERLDKERERLSKLLDKLRTQISNPEFVGKAPMELISKQKDLFSRTEKELDEVTSKLLLLKKS